MYLYSRNIFPGQGFLGTSSIVYDISDADSGEHHAAFWFNGPKSAEWTEPKSGITIQLRRHNSGWLDAGGQLFADISVPGIHFADGGHFTIDYVGTTAFFERWNPDEPIASWYHDHELVMQLFNGIKPGRGESAHSLDREGLMQTSITASHTLCGFLLLYETALYQDKMSN